MSILDTAERSLTTLALIFSASVALGQEVAEQPVQRSPLDDLNWIMGPVTADITSRAEITLPEGFTYLDSRDTKMLMELMENPSTGDEYYVGREDMAWFAVFSYQDTGYIRDDETIDPDELIELIREGSKASNEIRRERGWGELRVLGWAQEPFYEPESNRLAWAVVFDSDEGKVVNYNTRILGRGGVMEVTLVGDPSRLDTDVGEFRRVLTGFTYKPGNAYAEFREGDKVAAYGIAALVAGGAAAAVIKSGVGKGLLKFLWVAVVAFFAFVASAVKRLFGRTSD
jgi:uncharacterized membrane-anchored protein